jgi:UDP-N-acetylmuramate--alanine ligase
MKIHFIGIGGIGVSALAKYYLEKGVKVSGSDLAASEITDALKKQGAKVFIGKHKAGNVLKDVKLAVYSPAVKSNNPELVKARKLKIKAQSYPQALGELTKKYFTIAVTGTHGKSTTSAMIGLLLTKAGLDPTVIIGTKLKEFNDFNCRVGKSKYLVIEACEHEASFLSYWPEIIVVTNIEREHLDYYKNMSNILKAFRKFISHLAKDGTLVVNRDNLNLKKVLSPKFQTKKYSLKQGEAKKIKKVLKVPGQHNVSNALAALTVARLLKIPDKVSFQALSGYQGAWRRFETTKSRLGDRKITVINDYAHHPTELKATLEATREKFPRKEIWAVFQPHQYQRTFYLFKEFIEVLSKVPVDRLIITDIYDVAGREQKTIKKSVSSEKLAEEIKAQDEVIYIPSIKGAADYLKRYLKGGEVVIIMGAGDIYKLADYFSVQILKVK